MLSVSPSLLLQLRLLLSLLPLRPLLCLELLPQQAELPARLQRQLQLSVLLAARWVVQEAPSLVRLAMRLVLVLLVGVLLAV